MSEQTDTATLVERVRAFITTGQIKRDDALAALDSLTAHVREAEAFIEHQGMSYRWAEWRERHGPPTEPA